MCEQRTRSTRVTDGDTQSEVVRRAAGCKTCSCCGETKSLDDFPQDQKAKDGLGYHCLGCCAKRANSRYRRNRRKSGAEYSRLLTDDEWREIEARGTMACRKCGREQPLDQFRPTKLPRRRRVCRDCRLKRAAELTRLKQADRRAAYQRYRCKQFGITPEDYDRMLEEQQGLCAICRRPLGRKGQTIDHCHRTGRVRGIVHSQCNLVIGNAREDIEVLRGAIAYLKSHQQIQKETAEAGSSEADIRKVSR